MKDVAGLIAEEVFAAFGTTVIGLRTGLTWRF
jgi:hypothetical protein